MTPAHFFTLLPPGWELTPKELRSTDPRKLIHALRARLDRAGAVYASGWLIGFIDGDFDQQSKSFELHVHGLATGGMVDIVRELGRQGNFRSTRPNGQRLGSQRVMVSQNPVEDLLATTTYVRKGYWPAIPSYTNKAGKLERGKPIQMPEPYASEALLWLDRWGLADLTLLMKLEVVGGKLRTR